MGMRVPAGLCQVCLAPCKGRYCPEHRRAAKYRNKKTPATKEGIYLNFDSKKEADRFLLLWHLQKVGLISLLCRQPRFPLVVGGKLVCTYVADFQYYDHGLDRIIVEDAKGMRTRTYRIKAKLFAALTGYAITEV